MPEKEHNEIKKFLNFYSYIVNIEISAKTKENLNDLLNEIYKAVNPEPSNNNLLPINQVTKYSGKELLRMNYDGALSLILVGSSGVGKTNFMTRFSNNVFNIQSLSNTGINKEMKSIKINNKECFHLTLWDTAGQERYRSLPRSYYKNVDGVLLLFDINEKTSFKDVTNWMNEINQYSPVKRNEDEENKENIDDVIVYLIGNKIDVINNDETKEKVTQEEKEELINKLGVKYYEVSCKWNLNIEEVMTRIILDSYRCNRRKNRKESTLQLQRDSDTRNGNTNNRRGGCC